MGQKLFQFILLFLAVSPLTAQKVLWAERVIEVSSEHTDAFYSPKFRSDQILGTPSIYPQLVESPCAWQPNGSDFGEDYIKVGFSEAIHVKQIAVIENVNPGAIVRIFGYGESGEEYLLYQNAEDRPRVKGRFWRVAVQTPAKEKVKAIKLLIYHPVAKGIKQYDAIAISDDDAFIPFKINEAEDFKEDIQKVSLGPTVNSAYGEVAPIITPDGQKLFFTRLNHPENIQDKKNKGAIRQDIWYSYKNEHHRWSVPENLGSPINNDLDNAASTASADGSKLYILNVYNADGSMSEGLSKTTFRNNEWSKPAKVLIENFQALSQFNPNTNANEISTEYAISHDEKVLIMGLKRSQTFGEKDLYVSFLQSNGSYSSPLNLGKTINTADNEGSPFLGADNKTLYFNSKGHPGYGDADIYVTRRLDDTWTNWSEPLNLGPKINSPYWDGYFSIPASGDFALLSSRSDAIGEEDLFTIALSESIKPEPMVFMKGKIVDEVSNLPIRISPKIIALEDTTRNFSMEFGEDGVYSVLLPLGFHYKFEFKYQGYLYKEDSLDISNTELTNDITRVFTLAPIKAGKKITLEQVYFDQGKHEVKESSYPELARIIDLMKEYPSMEVLLEGHTDNQGDFTLNVELAQKRVDAVKEYLVKTGGIAAGRVETKSWGPLKPISSNVTPELRKKNRRVEFTIIKM